MTSSVAPDALDMQAALEAVPGKVYGLVPSFLLPAHKGKVRLQGREYSLDDLFKPEAAEYPFTAEEVAQAFLERARKSLQPYWPLKVDVPEKAGMSLNLSQGDRDLYRIIATTFTTPLAELTLLQVKETLRKPLNKVLPFLARVEKAAYLAGAPVKTAYAPVGGPNEEAIELTPEQLYEASALAQMSWVESLHTNDLRLLDLQLRVPPAQMIRDVVNREDVFVPLSFVKLLARLETLAEYSLSGEVLSILEAIANDSFSKRAGPPTAPERSLQLATKRFFYPTEASPTLAELSAETGVSGERVRQLLRPFTTALSGKGSFSIATPVLDAVLRDLKAMVPCSHKDAQAALQPHFGEGGGVSSLLELSVLMGKDLGFDAEVLASRQQPDGVALVDSYYKPLASPSVLPLLKTLESELRWCGATTLVRMAGLLALEGYPIPPKPELVASLEAAPGFRWLDRDLGWFTAGDTSNIAFAIRVRKLLEVAAQALDGARILEAVCHDDNLPYQPAGAALPPGRILVELLCGWPWVARVQSRRVSLSAEYKEKSVLNKYEQVIVRLFEKKGTEECSTFEMAAALKAEGYQSYTTVSAWLSNSPILRRSAKGSYRLAGGA